MTTQEAGRAKPFSEQEAVVLLLLMGAAGVGGEGARKNLVL